MINRRTALGIGSAAAATVALSTATGTAASAAPVRPQGPVAPVDSPASTPVRARREVSLVYQAETERAGGVWNSYLSIANPDGSIAPAVVDKADELVEAYSVNKVAVAVAVLDKVDRGLVRLDHRLEVSSAIVLPGGIFHFDGAYPSTVTLGHALVTLLTVSDNTAVRLCGLVCPALELNEILVRKGFTKTQVIPVANPNRFFLGQTTARETHDLLHRLTSGTLLSAASTAYLLGILRSPIAFTDGIRRTMSSAQRDRIATKAGWLNDGRNEAGIIFDRAGAPVLTFALFARGQADTGNFGATHPAVAARAVLGRRWLSIVDDLSGAARLARPVVVHPQVNGG